LIKEAEKGRQTFEIEQFHTNKARKTKIERPLGQTAE
jgi:hypothetical protein